MALLFWPRWCSLLSAGLLQLRRAGALYLQGTGSRVQYLPQPSARGLVALRRVGSFPTRGGTCVPCTCAHCILRDCAVTDIQDAAETQEKQTLSIAERDS